jgi:type III secretion protein L
MSSKIIKKATDEMETPVAPVAGAKIIDREVLAATDQARRILEAAQAQAEEIRAQAQQEYEEAIRRGYQEGYEKGLAEWLRAIEEVHAGLTSLVEQAKPQIVRLALRVAEKILRQRLDLTPEAVVPMIDEALRSLRAQQNMRVLLRVHPDDRPILEPHRQRWMERLPWLGSLDIVVDEDLPRGGCRIETDFGTVDATIETQIRVIERHLLGGGEG